MSDLERFAAAQADIIEQQQAEINRTRGVIDRLYDGVPGLDAPLTLALLRNFFEATPGSGYYHLEDHQQ